MKKVLIISSTRNSNLDLSKDIKNYLMDKDELETEVIALEDFELPLYTPTLEEQFKSTESFPKNISKIKDLICSSDVMIWCSPEYNGGISPIVTNTIAWISRATDDWKEGFKDKHCLICTSSGGNGKNFIKGFEMQLKYLGSNVFDRSLIKTKAKNIEGFEFTSVLTDFYKNIFSE